MIRTTKMTRTAAGIGSVICLVVGIKVGTIRTMVNKSGTVLGGVSSYCTKCLFWLLKLVLRPTERIYITSRTHTLFSLPIPAFQSHRASKLECRSGARKCCRSGATTWNHYSICLDNPSVYLFGIVRKSDMGEKKWCQ